MGENTIRIFIASSAELKDEREKCVLLLNQLNKSHSHLQLEPVEWEFDMVHGNNPGYETIQDAINPLLKESHLAVFIFHSKIGKYTRQEFDYATKENKRLFAYFKSGFSPSKNSLTAYSELLDFKEGLNDIVLYKEYSNLMDFEKQLYPNLNLYLTETYSKKGEVEGLDATATLSQSNLLLIRMLEEKEGEIKALKLKIEEGQNKEPGKALQTLIQKKSAIQNQLLQSEEIRQQQAAEKEALQNRLSLQVEQDSLKAKALEEVEKGNYSEAEAYLKESAKEKISDVASTFFELAKIKKLQLQYADAFHYYELAVKINPENSLYLNDAGGMADNLGDANKAISYFEKSLEIDRKEKGEEHPDIATRYNNLGSAYNSKGEYDKAISYYEKALALGKQFYGEEHPNIAKDYNNLGAAYNSKGEYDKAISHYEKALALGKQFYGEEHPDIAIRYNNLGAAYDSKGEYDKAISYYEKALVLDKQFYGEEHPKIAIRYNNLGLSYNSKGEYDKAISYYEKALVLDKQFYGEKHPDIAKDYNNLGAAYDSKGAYDKAISHYEKALALGKQFYGEEHPNIAICYNNLGSAYYNEGEYDKAISYCNLSLQVLSKFISAEHPNFQMIQQNLDYAKAALKKQNNS